MDVNIHTQTYSEKIYIGINITQSYKYICGCVCIYMYKMRGLFLKFYDDETVKNHKLQWHILLPKAK